LILDPNVTARFRALDRAVGFYLDLASCEIR